MKILLQASIAAAALAMAAPASAALTLVGSGCSVTTPDPDAVACAGAYAGNLNDNNRIDDLNAAVDVLMGTDVTNFTWTAVEATKDFFESSGQTLTFDALLYGEQIFSFHFGDAGSGDGNYTVLYLFDFGAEGAGSVNLGANGFSNGVILPPPGGVPEPATWAMMLIGFTGIGFAVRRGRKPGLLQVA
jgi:hypothetical protein